MFENVNDIQQAQFFGHTKINTQVYSKRLISGLIPTGAKSLINQCFQS